MKFFCGVMALLFIVTVYANDLYQMEGTVSVQAADASTIMIDYQQYHIDHKTTVHGMVKQGERGPVISPEQKIGFNVEYATGEIPRISEVWFLQ